MQGKITVIWILDLCMSHNWNLKSFLAVSKTKMYQFAIKHIVSQLAIKPVYTKLNTYDGCIWLLNIA
jgi:hypothetical protein